MVDHARAARMAKRIQQIVATSIEREIKDPRLELVTITAVSYTHLTLPTKSDECRSRWSPYH